MQALYGHAGHPPLFSLVSLTLIVLVSLAYLSAAHRHDGNGAARIAFVVGSVLLGIAVSPTMVEWAHHDLRGHMLQHLLIGMFAPLAWVLAAPVTLLLRSLPTGVARRVVFLLKSPPIRVVSHPLSALVLNIGGMYVLYLTPLYATMLDTPALHYWMHLHFLLAGYLFCWSILAGPDAASHTLGMRFRLTVLGISIAAHAILGKLMYGYLWPRGTPHSQEEIQAAAQLMYYGGDLAEALLAIVLFAMWYRTREPRPRTLRL